MAQRSYFCSFSSPTYAPGWYSLKKKKGKIKELYNSIARKGRLKAQLPTVVRVNLDKVAQSLVQVSSECLHMVHWVKQRNNDLIFAGRKEDNSRK